MEPQILRYLLDKACAMRQPVSGTLELTGRCNLSCKMCYIHQTKQDKTVAQRELSTAQWLELIRQVQEAGTLTMLLTGGEPLLRPDFEELYTACRRSGFLVSVNTNASLMTERHFDLFQKNRPFILNISLYGADDETYEEISGQAHIFERVRANILELRRRDIPVKINYTVTKENYHQREEIFAFAKENGCLIQQTSYLFPPVRTCEGCAGDYLRVDAKTAGEMMFVCDTLRYDTTELRHRLQQRGPNLRFVPEEDGTHMHCRGGVSAYWITYDGQLQVCGMMPQPKADLKAMAFAEAWEQVKNDRASILLPQDCTSCADQDWCENCAAICSAEACGTQPPDYICQKTRAYRACAEQWLTAHKETLKTEVVE